MGYTSMLGQLLRVHFQGFLRFHPTSPYPRTDAGGNP